MMKSVATAVAFFVLPIFGTHKIHTFQETKKAVEAVPPQCPEGWEEIRMEVTFGKNGEVKAAQPFGEFKEALKQIPGGKEVTMQAEYYLKQTLWMQGHRKTKEVIDVPCRKQ